VFFLLLKVELSPIWKGGGREILNFTDGGNKSLHTCFRWKQTGINLLWMGRIEFHKRRGGRESSGLQPSKGGGGTYDLVGREKGGTEQLSATLGEGFFSCC